jgi:hypothetical protein
MKNAERRSIRAMGISLSDLLRNDSRVRQRTRWMARATRLGNDRNALLLFQFLRVTRLGPMCKLHRHQQAARPWEGIPPIPRSRQARPAEPLTLGRGLLLLQPLTILQIRRLARVSWYVRFDFTSESSMPSHKYSIGQVVQLIPSISRNVPGGSFEITKQLPESGGEFEYRIKSMNERHERVVRESELQGA